MTTFTIRALQWARLPDLGDVAPLDDADLACMADLREVLRRHARLHRFALHLVHKHFELGVHEVLVESCDPVARELRLRVEPRRPGARRDTVPTTWLLAPEQPVVVCLCINRPGQGHLGRHDSA